LADITEISHQMTIKGKSDPEHGSIWIVEKVTRRDALAVECHQLQCINCQAQWPAFSESVYEIVRAESSPCPNCGSLTLEHKKMKIKRATVSFSRGKKLYPKAYHFAEAA